ncbi:MAG: cell division protein ZapD [Gammaproteobacteria bacterium]|jgi:cell division protein ZapD
MESITYEQPLNELVRVSLRLEHILQQLNALTTSQPTSIQITRSIIRLMIDAINILDRPDFKTKLSKEFDRHITVLHRLHTDPKVNQATLNTTLTQLKQYKNHLITTQGKIAQNLRANEFLTTIRQSLLSPGGDGCIDNPGYFYWLNHPAESHQIQIDAWLAELAEIRQAINLLLNIIRNSSKAHDRIAKQGFYHETLDPQLPYQLIRVTLPKEVIFYPEISAGRHRMTIRFIIPDVTDHPKQTNENVKFALTKCIL